MLRLQSGTSVYTKKVEYLLALTYETLSHFAVPSRSISSQEGPARRGGKAGGKRYGRGVEDWESLDLFSVPWHVAVRMQQAVRFYYSIPAFVC